MSTHLIKFSGKKDYTQAIAALADVAQTRVGLPDFKMMVTEEHLEALDKSKISYIDLTQEGSDEQAQTPSLRS